MPVVLHTSAVKRWLFKIRHWSIFIFTTSNKIAIGKTHYEILNVSFVVSGGIRRIRLSNLHDAL